MPHPRKRAFSFFARSKGRLHSHHFINLQTANRRFHGDDGFARSGAPAKANVTALQQQLVREAKK